MVIIIMGAIGIATADPPSGCYCGVVGIGCTTAGCGVGINIIDDIANIIGFILRLLDAVAFYALCCVVASIVFFAFFFGVVYVCSVAGPPAAGTAPPAP
ncbi:unnamed protein product, partial [Rotaria socialis]